MDLFRLNALGRRLRLGRRVDLLSEPSKSRAGAPVSIGTGDVPGKHDPAA